MIVSHKYKFIFVKTIKTAGTSIEIFLSPHCGEEDIVTPIVPHVTPHVPRNHGDEFFNHMPARRIRKLVGADVWQRYYTFCVERNPWDKTLSHYHMFRYRSGGRLTLDEYFEKGRFCLNYPKYTGQRGRIMVDRVLKYERLSQELAEVFAQLGIPYDGSLGIRAKSEYRNDHRPYQQVLTEEQRNIVEEAFAKEIELFGYRFDDTLNHR